MSTIRITAIAANSCYFFEGGRDRCAQDVGAELKLYSQRQVSPQVQPDLRVGVLPQPQQGQGVQKGSRKSPNTHYGRTHCLDS